MQKVPFSVDWVVMIFLASHAPVNSWFGSVWFCTVLIGMLSFYNELHLIKHEFISHNAGEQGTSWRDLLRLLFPTLSNGEDGV